MIVLTRKSRLPEARGADTGHIVPNQIGQSPHGKGLERQKDLGIAPIAHILEHGQIAPHRRLVNDEAGRGHTAQIKFSKGPGAARLGFHRHLTDQKSKGAGSSSTFQGRPCLFRRSMKGSGSSCSILNTPAPAHWPVSIRAAPIMAGTPVV